MTALNSCGILNVRLTNIFKQYNNIQYDGQAVWCRFWLFQRKMYAKYVNNKQREGQAIKDDIKKIAVVKFSMNRTYLCVS